MFSETIVSEMVQIGILVTLLVSEYEKYTKIFVSELWFDLKTIIKTIKYMALRSWAKFVSSEIVYMYINILLGKITRIGSFCSKIMNNFY